MALSVGEIEATLRLRDEMSAQLRNARTAVDQFGVALGTRLRDAAYSSAAATKALITEQNQHNALISKFMGYDAAAKATQYADAVAHVGGVLFLTKREQAEVNAVMQAAIEKSKAMGEQVPLDIQRLAERTADAAAKSRDWSAALTSLGQTMTRTGAVLTAGVTAPLVGAAVASSKLAMDFETGMTKVQTLSGVSAERVAVMTGQVKELAVASGIGPDELAKALLVVTSTGLRGSEAMEILTASATSAAVGLGETSDVARAITAAITAYGKENLNAADAADKLFVAVREGGAEAEGFARTLGRVFGVAAQLGVTFDEVSASVATYTRLGVNASEAVTALRGTLMILLHPAKQARDAAAELGTSFTELRQSVRERGLMATLSDLVRLAGSNEEALGKLFPNVRALAGVLGNTGKQAEAYKEILGKVRDEHGALGDAMKVTTETSGFKWNQLMAEAKVIAIEFGEALAPTLRMLLAQGKEVLGWVSGMVQWWSQLPAPVREASLAVAAVAAALGPLLVVGGQLVLALASLVGLFGGAGVTGVAGAAGLAATAISAAFVPALLAIAIPAALYEVVRLFSQIKGYFADSAGWDRDAKGLADTMKNEMATAARLAGREFVTYAEAHAFMIQRAKDLRAATEQTNAKLELQGKVVTALMDPQQKLAYEAKRAAEALVQQGNASADGAQKNKMAAEATLEQAHALRLLTEWSERQAAIAKARGAAEEAAYKKSVAAAEKYIAQLPTAIFQTRSFAGAVEQVSEAAAKYQGNLAGASKETESFGDKVKKSLGDGMMRALDDLPRLLQSAFEGGGAFMGALKSFATKVGSEIGGAIGFALGGPLGQKLGEAIGSLAGPLVGLFGKLFGTAGRDAVLEFAKSMGGFDALHEQLLRLGAAGEQLWIKLTQGVGRNNPEQAKRVIAEIEAALRNIPPTMEELASQAGFKTTQQLQKAAVDAVKLWEFMRDSGQYSAEAVAAAWQRAQDALKVAGGEQLATLQKSYDAAVENLKALDAEMASLQKSIDAEAPEEAMGVVEAQSRARLEALKQERDAAAKHVEELQGKLQRAMEDLAKSFREAVEGLGRLLDDIADRKITIPVEFDTSGGKGGDTGTSDSVPSFANEGRVTRPTLALIGDAPEPEFVLRQSTVERLGGGGGLTVHLTLAQPVMADDYGALTRMGDFVGRAIEQKLRALGITVAGAGG